MFRSTSFRGLGGLALGAEAGREAVKGCDCRADYRRYADGLANRFQVSLQVRGLGGDFGRGWGCFRFALLTGPLRVLKSGARRVMAFRAHVPVIPILVLFAVRHAQL